MNGNANNNFNNFNNKGSFLNDISIEGIDDEGRCTLKSLSGRDSSASIGSGNNHLKWKRKSELSNSILSMSNKSRISIKGANQYEYILKQDDPFNYGNRQSHIAGGPMNDQQKAMMNNGNQL